MLLCRFHIGGECIFPSPGKCLTMRNSFAQKQSAQRSIKSDTVIYHSEVTDYCRSCGTRKGVAELCNGISRVYCTEMKFVAQFFSFLENLCLARSSVVGHFLPNLQHFSNHAPADVLEKR